MTSQWSVAASVAGVTGVGLGAAAAYGCSRGCTGARGEAITGNYEGDHTRWTSNDVAAWLVSKGITSESAIIFKKENIDGSILKSVTSDTLKQMGVTKLGDLMKIETLIAQLLDEQPASPVSQVPVGETERSRVVNPLDPEVGILRKAVVATATARTATVPSPTAAAAAPETTEESMDARYASIVDGNIESLERVASFITSREFKIAPAAQQKIQLKKVVELLTNLLGFSEEIPPAEAQRLVQHIQAVYTHVKSFGDLDDEGEQTGEEKKESEKSARLVRILQFKKYLASSDDEDLGGMMEELRAVVGDIDNCSDMEELQALNEVFELLQERNSALHQKAEELKSQKTQALQENGEKKLLLTAQLLNKDFSVIPLHKQEEYLRTAVDILSSYMESEGSNPTLCLKLRDLIKLKKNEYETNKAAAGGNAVTEESPIHDRLLRLTELLASDKFETFPMKMRFEVLERAYNTLDTLSPESLAQHHEVTTKLVGLLKERHVQTARASGIEESNDDDDEEVRDEESSEPPMSEVVKANNRSPQNEVNLLPKVFERLKTFGDEGATQFEFNTLLWVVAQISQVLSKVLPADQFRDMMEPVHKMLMHRMDETTNFPSSKHKSSVGFAFKKTADTNTFVLNVSDKATISEVAKHDETEETPSRKVRPLSAILIGADSAKGTESLEVQHVAYFLRKELGYEVMCLTGKDATAQNLEMAIRASSLVIVRGTVDAQTKEIALQDGSVSLKWLRERANEGTAFVLDGLTECSFATMKNEITLELDDATVTEMNCTLSWLFDGIFLPLIPEMLTLPEAPRTIGGLVTSLQEYLIGDMPYQYDVANASMWNTVISYGDAEEGEGDEDEDEDADENEDNSEQ